MDAPIHVAITRRVKPGHERDFEKAVLACFADSLRDTTTQGALLLRPLPESDSRTYGILRSFASEQERNAFYKSDAFTKLQQAIEPYVEDDVSRRELHGLEAFFYNPSLIHHPPRWKMAFVTWLGVWPTVYAASNLVGPRLSWCHSFVSAGIVTLFVVLVLAWGVMPILTRLLRPWLMRS
jgi:uncharacterized protein